MNTIEVIMRKTFQWGFRKYSVRVWKEATFTLKMDQTQDKDVLAVISRYTRPIGDEEVMGKEAPIEQLLEDLSKVNNVLAIEVTDENGNGIIVRTTKGARDGEQTKEI